MSIYFILILLKPRKLRGLLDTEAHPTLASPASVNRKDSSADQACILLATSEILKRDILVIGLASLHVHLRLTMLSEGFLKLQSKYKFLVIRLLPLAIQRIEFEGDHNDIHYCTLLVKMPCFY